MRSCKEWWVSRKPCLQWGKKPNNMDLYVFWYEVLLLLDYTRTCPFCGRLVKLLKLGRTANCKGIGLVIHLLVFVCI